MALGFGGSVLGGDLSLAAQRKLVEAAFEAGFRYFDVAPSYGHGGAERVVGEVLAGVREQVRIATKVGILHPRPLGPMALARRVLRPLRALAPGLWGRAAVRVRQSAAPRGQFGAAAVEATLRESLQRLRTRRVDHLLLHEAAAADVDERLLAWLRTLQREGVVGTIGLGTSVEETGRIVTAHSGVFETVQVDHYWGAFSGFAAESAGTSIVTHRCLRSGFTLARSAALQEALSDHDHRAELRRLLADRRAAPELLLKAGLCAVPHGRLLVSSSDPHRIRAFARWASESALSIEARSLNQCLQRIAEPGTTFRGVVRFPRSIDTTSVTS